MIKFLNDWRLKRKIYRCGSLLSLSRLYVKFFAVNSSSLLSISLLIFCFLRLRIYVSLLLDIFIYLGKRENSNYMNQQRWSWDANVPDNETCFQDACQVKTRTSVLPTQSKHFTFYDFSLLNIFCVRWLQIVCILDVLLFLFLLQFVTLKGEKSSFEEEKKFDVT